MTSPNVAVHGQGLIVGIAACSVDLRSGFCSIAAEDESITCATSTPTAAWSRIGNDCAANRQNSPRKLCRPVIGTLFPDAPDADPAGTLLWCTGRAALADHLRRPGAGVLRARLSYQPSAVYRRQHLRLDPVITGDQLVGR
jgi:hypothetical protein